MSVWRRRALGAFPQLRWELQQQDYSIYMLYFDLLPMAREAHDTNDTELLLRETYASNRPSAGNVLDRGRVLSCAEGDTMATRISEVVQHLRKVMLRQDGAGLSDGHTLVHGMLGSGYFHLVLADPERYSRMFANVYFGTGDNVLRKKSW